MLDTGNTAWLLTSSALVLMMTLPGLALFYAGLVRAKNTLSLFMQCLVAAGVVGVLWIMVGYTLAFAPATPSSATCPSSGSPASTPARSGARYGIPEYLFVMFQAMFAIITPALMIGAFAERMRFGPYLAFITLWLLVVYCPLAHMVWGGGWIGAMGAKDFAGGLVVHMSSGFSALVAAIFLGKRRGFGKEPMPPHNLPLAVIGAGLLWVGWFGFNAGSELMADGVAALAFLTTSTAASTALVTWMGIEWLHRGKPTVLGAATALVAGPGGDHAGLRLRDADGLDRGRHRRLGAVLRRGHLPEADVRLRRLARRVRRARHRRHAGARSRPGSSSRRGRCPRA